ncbi:MAG: acetyl-CoA carboxylase biotin carboxyl carrier protein [Candidatus Omnitrophica bacterium]|nr:acetyl-CoA carboxylase biotin carboxyl carrier protein [Candidatus Omnitrophota bacterium]
MNIKEIKEMIILMNENNLSEFELEKQGLKIRLRKGSDGLVEKVIERPVAPVLSAANAPQAGPGGTAQAAASKANEIKSPMVGTFYAAPSPDAQPFVGPGDIIEVGQVVCIIEAMKLMNEIKSDIKGKVTSVLVENSDPVEFGQALFLVEPI